MTSTIRVLFLALLTAAGAKAQEPPRAVEQRPPETSEVTQRAEMRREVEEAVQAINAYSVGRRSDAAIRAQRAMADIDGHLRRFRAEWFIEAKRINDRSEANRDKALAEARERRAELERQYHAMQESNAQSWERARDGFTRAYRNLAVTLGVRRAEPETADEAESQEKKAKPNEPKVP